MTEQSTRDQRLTRIASDMLIAFQGLPRDMPPAPVRDMTLGQLRLLFLLQRVGSLPMGRIAEVFDLSTTASSGFVARIERYGLVERIHSSTDRRVVECSLSEAGRRFVEGVSGVRLDHVRQGLAKLDDVELAELGRLLGLVRERSAVPA